MYQNTIVHWASTGGQVVYFKTKVFFFLNFPFLVLSFSLILHFKSSLTLKKLCLVKDIQQELSLALKKAILVCCSVRHSVFGFVTIFFCLISSMLKYKNNHTLSQGGLDIGLKVGILAEIGYMLYECALHWIKHLWR